MKEKIYIKDFLNILLNHKKALIFIMFGSVMGMIQLSFVLPKTYKTNFELNIYSKYFKNALISEVIPGMNSIAEMTQTTDSMVKETLNDEFIDGIGRDFNIYAPDLSPQQLSKAREQLRDRFEMFSTGGQSYQVGFSYGDPTVTYEVSNRVMEAIKDKFINSRLETIETAKKTISQSLESLTMTKHIAEDSISSNALASKNPEILKSEINKINSDLSALKLQFNTHHPQIVKLEQRKATIENWLSELEATGEAEETEAAKDGFSDAPLLLAGSKDFSKDITAKMVAKFNDINIALDIERKSLPGYIGVIKAPQIPNAPLFPKRRLFASLGFVLGLVLSFGYVFFKEVVQFSSDEKASQMAEDLKSTFMGTMPHIDEESLMTAKAVNFEELRLLEAPVVYYMPPPKNEDGQEMRH